MRGIGAGGGEQNVRGGAASHARRATGGLAARFATAALGTLLTLTLAPPARAAAPPGPDSLRARAFERYARATADMRRLALQDLEQATRLAPERADLWLDCGRMQLKAGEGGKARASFQRAATLVPDDADAQVALGQAFKWDWLESLEEDSFRRAAAALARATAIAPERPEAWIELAALALVKGDAKLAADASVHANHADPSGAAATLALACAAYRLGRMPLADSLFRAAELRLPEALARRFKDLGVVTGRSAPAESAAAAAERAERYWSDHDPDLTTPESELRLGYLARLGHAILLFRDGDDVRWDLRTELLVRYGVPDRIVRNRPNSNLQSKGLFVKPDMAADAVEFGYPFNEQVWSYSALGIEAVLWDRMLSGKFSLPVAYREDPDPRPDPAVLAQRGDLVVLGDGRGVYRALPPGRHPRTAVAHVSRFPSAGGTRVLAHLTTPGGPADTLRGRWVVLDPSRREVARADAALSVSACDPTGARTAEFAADLPPGDYRVGFSVEDTRGGKGLVNLPLKIEAPPAGLAISDLVLLCGDAATAVSETSVRIEPSMTAKATHRRTLAVYFEVARLATGAANDARFSYTYRVIEYDDIYQKWKKTPALEASREEDNTGPLRRQFLRLPIQKLRAGTFELQVEVRDLIAGTVAKAEKRFEIDAP